ncbi:FecR family protein [Pedobacter nyackensis]|uniref:FecR family protein n=1 Tax=Pedobacter nyackensis TaxID=475255 RepID=UPI00292D520E|nr:FecR family protein [Pedobacter nyackensis]
MSETQTKLLLSRYKLGACTEEELAMLESWYQSSAFVQPELAEEELYNAKIAVWKNLPIHQQHPEQISLLARLSVAASLLIIIGLGWFYFSSTKNPATRLASLEQIMAGGNKATLILANGKRIPLTDIPEGKVTSLPGIRVTKTNHGQLVYQTEGQQTGNRIEYNTIETPVGGTYELVLLDGTRIWLNAGSSLKYPAMFAKDERKVELIGEAYFEVSHNPKKPFIVKTANRQVVKVLGTHFNLNAYPDDQVYRTTLFEGKVEVSNGRTEVILKPFQQALLQNGALTVNEVADATAISWKDEQFAFKDETLENILNEFERWYDVEFICPEEFKNIRFSGKISRKRTLKQALNIIDREGTVHFKNEGRRIWVTK